jgi:hypothetical protein
MARFKKFLDGEGLPVVVNLDAVVTARFRSADTIYVILQGRVEHTLRVTLDFFMDHLTGERT